MSILFKSFTSFEAKSLNTKLELISLIKSMLNEAKANHLTIHKLTFMSHQSSHIIPSHTSSLGNHVARRNEAEDARRAAADAHRQYCALASGPIIWPPALAEQQQPQLAFLWTQIDPQ